MIHLELIFVPVKFHFCFLFFVFAYGYSVSLAPFVEKTVLPLLNVALNNFPIFVYLGDAVA